MTGPAAGAVRTGLEVFLEEGPGRFAGARIGLIANQASVDGRLRGAARLLAACPGLTLTALFGPEHGLQGVAQDMIPVASGRDGESGLAVHSLYGDTPDSLAPTAEMLEGVDLLVADLQDVGARYYTFAATIAHALEAIAKRGGRLLVLDRPNPIGGLLVEGPALRPDMRSFVGHIEVPVRHALTMGELVLHHARTSGLAHALEVVPMRGWRRSMQFADTGLPWVPPSPNMPTPDTALVYPGACLVEATNLSEGRGTTRPFEWIGAPFLEPQAFADALEAGELPGVSFRPQVFVPAFHKWSGRPCGGVALHVTDPERFRPVRTGIAILSAARRLAPDRFAWRSEPYEFVADRPAIDLLTGGPEAREGIERGAPLADLVTGWAGVEKAWDAARRDILLYS